MLISLAVAPRWSGTNAEFHPRLTHAKKGLALRGVAVDYTVVIRIAGWSSLVARQAHNLKAVGSNPTPATNSQARNYLGSKHLRRLSFSSSVF